MVSAKLETANVQPNRYGDGRSKSIEKSNEGEGATADGNTCLRGGKGDSSCLGRALASPSLDVALYQLKTKVTQDALTPSSFAQIKNSSAEDFALDASAVVEQTLREEPRQFQEEEQQQKAILGSPTGSMEVPRSSEVKERKNQQVEVARVQNSHLSPKKQMEELPDFPELSTRPFTEENEKLDKLDRGLVPSGEEESRRVGEENSFDTSSDLSISAGSPLLIEDEALMVTDEQLPPYEFVTPLSYVKALTGLPWATSMLPFHLQHLASEDTLLEGDPAREQQQRQRLIPKPSVLASEWRGAAQTCENCGASVDAAASQIDSRTLVVTPTVGSHLEHCSHCIDLHHPSAAPDILQRYLTALPPSQLDSCVSKPSFGTTMPRAHSNPFSQSFHASLHAPGYALRSGCKEQHRYCDPYTPPSHATLKPIRRLAKVRPYANQALPVSAQEVKKAIPCAASSIFHVVDRRVNLDAFHVDEKNGEGKPPVYSILRAWVQDNPHRQISISHTWKKNQRSCRKEWTKRRVDEHKHGGYKEKRHRSASA